MVCAPDPDSLDFTKSVSKLLLLLYGERHDRLRDDHSLINPTVNVWLTERVESGLSPDTGGEQFQNQIYLYNVHNPRSDVEWARKVIASFALPENSSKGVITIEGRMVERLHLAMAERLVAIVEAISHA